MRTLGSYLALLIGMLILSSVSSWKLDIVPKSLVDSQDLIDYSRVQEFVGNETSTDHFRILLREGDTMLIGARNYVYNISMRTLMVNKKIEWYSPNKDVDMCLLMRKTSDQCQNYIRVAERKEDGSLLICGTNSYRPGCRIYGESDVGYELIKEETGIARCPHDPNHNSTSIYVDGRLFSATVADINSRDPLIYSQPMRTEQHDSQWLNEPNFVKAIEYGDKVYFLFRETAVEYINCGKRTYSRVGRVCKNDQGGMRVLRNTWTSFFKSRLNCSIPGEFPFYFDEIQSASDLGQGNFMPTSSWTNRTDMIYGVFTTPLNSISGSAICAFRFSDIIKTFGGAFKAQKTAHSNWLPVNEMETPRPHPARECANESGRVMDQTLNFIKSHPLMDESVPSYGGQPIIMQTSFSSRFTKIAIDWQVQAADGHYYDVIFAGTDDGRIIKAINKGRHGHVETVVIEDIQVFQPRTPVADIQVFRDIGNQEEKLLVMSQHEIKAIPLHRCHFRVSCGGCVALQDPYCSWTDQRCENSNSGMQSIETGEYPGCRTQEVQTEIERRVTQPMSNNIVDETSKTDDEDNDIENSIPIFHPSNEKERAAGLAVGSTQQQAIYTAQTLAISTVISIVLALFVGFVIGYRVSIYKMNTRLPYIDRKLDLEQPRNLNFNRIDNYTPPPEKQLNLVCNPLKGNPKLPNGSAETKVQPQPHKVKKVYL